MSYGTQGPRDDPIYEKEGIEVIFRKSRPLSTLKGRDPGFNPGTTVLPKGFTKEKGRRALPCDIIFERDVAVKMRDGTTIYIDVFRPSEAEKVPAIIGWGPFGKQSRSKLFNLMFGIMGIPKNAISGFQGWEAPDPAYWCGHGYAIINPDTRGVYRSEGDIPFWGTQEAEDGHDLIEWLAKQEWCNGKVGLSGNSWLAIIQWFIASKQPPHLAAIAPWEGVSDFYYEDICRGGIPDPAFNETVVNMLFGNNRTEDTPAMIKKYPLMNAYWKDKAADLEKITVPAYVVASYTNQVHTAGTFSGFRRISSKDKWLRVHNTQEWVDYYTPEYTDDLQRFFDYYLKRIENNWEQTPKIRLSVLDPGGKDIINREEKEFPLKRTEHQKLYLDAKTGELSEIPIVQTSSTVYKSDHRRGKAIFSMTFERDTELTGYLKLRLWVETKDSKDMDIFVFAQKFDEKGKQLIHFVLPLKNRIISSALKFLHLKNILSLGMFFYGGPKGRLRVSHRKLDTERSTPSEPYLTHSEEDLLDPGQIVPVDIPLWPTGMLFHKGERLRLVIAGYNIESTLIPGMAGVKNINKGDHIIHTGGEYDSHLLVPKILP